MRTFLFVMLLFIVVSCSKENDSDNQQWNIIKVEGPSSGNLFQAIKLTVYWPYSSGCDNLDKFEESRSGNIINVKAYGHRSTGTAPWKPESKLNYLPIFQPPPESLNLGF